MPRGKEKGSEFERVAAKELSLWLSRGKSEDLLWRNVGIPSRGCGHRVEHQYGDIHSIHSEGSEFSRLVNVECKFYREIDLLELVDRPTKKTRSVVEWWKQCCGDAKLSKRFPLLVMKRNHGDPCIMYPFLLRHSDPEEGLCIFGLEEKPYVSSFGSLLRIDPVGWVDSVGNWVVERYDGVTPPT